jgi:ectoine hydroxylase-related dioxygenase (phytanoyl-CoA dioxygenase family)
MPVASPTSNPVQNDTQILTDAQVAAFKEQGFLSVDRVTSSEDVAEIRSVLEELFSQKAGHDQGAYFNFAGNEKDKAAPSLPQIISPVNFAARLKKSQFRHNATIIARQILGPEARFQIDHTLMKPPAGGAPTPWHQDEAFKDPNFDYCEISIWMPLQAVDEVNGCMEFIPGTHKRGMLPHRTPGNDPSVHALECYDGFDPADAVACPIPAGGCTIHYGRTLHGAGPNRSDAPRFAYVLIFQTPPEPAKVPKSFPWLKGRATGRMERQQDWLKKGGKFVRMWRWLRDREMRDNKRSLIKLAKKISAKFSSGEK